MRTETSKKRSKKNFYLCILKSIYEGNKLPKNYSKQRVNYYSKTLKTNGLIRKKGYGTWEITALGEQYLDQKQVKKFNLGTLVQPPPFRVKKQVKKWVRTHGLMWQIKCPVSYSRLNIFDILEKKGLCPEKLMQGQVKIKLYGHNIHFNKATITVWFDKMFYYKSKTATEGYKLAVYELKKLIVSLERILKTSLRIRKNHKFKPCKKHFGNVNNELASIFNKSNKSLRVYDQGKEWLIIDFSDQTFVELETTDNNRNIVDNDFIVNPFFNKLRKDPNVLDNLEDNLNRALGIIQKQNKVINGMQEQIGYLIEKETTSININRFKY